MRICSDGCGCDALMLASPLCFHMLCWLEVKGEDPKIITLQYLS